MANDALKRIKRIQNSEPGTVNGTLNAFKYGILKTGRKKNRIVKSSGQAMAIAHARKNALRRRKGLTKRKLKIKMNPSNFSLKSR